MSLNTGVRAANTNLMTRIVPECQNIGRSIKTSATVIVVMIVIVLILLVVSILYSYLKKIDATLTLDVASQESHKKKVVGGLTITASVLIFITAFVAVYQMSAVSRAARQCITV